MAWSFNNEEILAEWGDMAQCYKWLHTRSFSKYSFIHTCFAIPIIILSTSVGAISFLQINLMDNSRKSNLSPYITGAVNIFIGLLATIQEFLKVSEQQESHRIAYINWDKYSRNIRIELAKIPCERIDAHSFIKTCRMNFDNLMETSPTIQASVIHDFISTFEGKIGTRKRKIFDAVNKPDICKSIVSIDENRRKWFVDNQPLSNSTPNSHIQKVPRRRTSMKNDFSIRAIPLLPPRRKRSIDNYRNAIEFSNIMKGITDNETGNIRLDEHTTYNDDLGNADGDSNKCDVDSQYSNETDDKNSTDPRYRIDTIGIDSNELHNENNDSDNNIQVVFETNLSGDSIPSLSSQSSLVDFIPDVEDSKESYEDIITGGVMDAKEANSSFIKQFGQGGSKNEDLF